MMREQKHQTKKHINITANSPVADSNGHWLTMIHEVTNNQANTKWIS